MMKRLLRGFLSATVALRMPLRRCVTARNRQDTGT